jgi:hypothetical protein
MLLQISARSWTRIFVTFPGYSRAGPGPVWQVVLVALATSGWVGCGGAPDDAAAPATDEAAERHQAVTEAAPRPQEPEVEPSAPEQIVQIEASGCPETIASAEDEALGDALTNPAKYCEAEHARPMPTGDWACVEISSDRCPAASHHLECRRPLVCQAVLGAGQTVESGRADPAEDGVASPLQVVVTACPQAVMYRQERAFGEAMREVTRYCGDANYQLVAVGEYTCEEVPSDRCPDADHILECALPVRCETVDELRRAAAAARSAEKVDTCQDFPEKLRRCLPHECRFSHPFVRGFVVDQRIEKRVGEVCVTTQTVPGGALQTCRFPLSELERVADYFQDLREHGSPTRTTIKLEDGKFEAHSYREDEEIDPSVPEAMTEQYCTVAF